MLTAKDVLINSDRPELVEGHGFSTALMLSQYTSFDRLTTNGVSIQSFVNREGREGTQSKDGFIPLRTFAFFAVIMLFYRFISSKTFSKSHDDSH